MKRFIAVSLLLVPLAACSWFGSDATPDEPDVIVTERPETKNVIYRGTLLPLGASIYMEGTHRLELEDGRFVLLESNGLVLDEYLNEDVEVFGTTRATIEGSAIIMRVERVADLEVVSSAAHASSEAAVSSAMAVESSAPAAVSSTPVVVVVSSRAAASVAPPKPASSVAPPAPASSAAPVVVSSASSTDAAFQARVTTMAKAKMDAANWTRQYCAPSHLAFCFPVHKNWYYTSFGATSSSQWHVEASSEELVALGDGPISVVLLSGAAPGPDGQVTVEGGVATGVRTWTNNRHIVISAPVALEAAVRYMTQELKAASPVSSAAQ